MKNEIDLNVITPNKDNDKLFRDTIKPSEKKEDNSLEESVNTTEKLQYFTD